MQASVIRQSGITYVELLLALAIGSVLLFSLSGVVGLSLDIDQTVEARNDLTRQADFALQRMVRTVSHSRRLLLPLVDNPNTNWPEHIREESVPPAPPVGDSTKATAVLAVTLPAYVDLDGDGTPDADDDGDGLIDEDLPDDIHHDFAPGIALIDDDGDGTIDEGASGAEDDEDGAENEDPIDGADNDGDGSIDEDPPSDNNNDGCAGVCGVDDDSNGTIDGSGSADDDEDGGEFDDPYDPVVFYLNGGALMERMPVPWNEDGNSDPDGPVDGRDFVTSEIARNVTHFRVERVSDPTARTQLINLQLEMTDPETGEFISLKTSVRLGGAL